MSTLREDLANAEAKVEALKREIAGSACREAGHVWKHVAGRNAGCSDSLCCCSIPVHECDICGDSDYGDNAEARKIISDCAMEDRLRADEDWFFDMDGKP